MRGMNWLTMPTVTIHSLSLIHIWAEDQAEFDALAALPGFDWPGAGGPDDLPVPVHRILRASVDAALERYAGIAAADLTDTSGAVSYTHLDVYKRQEAVLKLAECRAAQDFVVRQAGVSRPY